MAGTYAKRTFPEGASLELYRRTDGAVRLKYLGVGGDEITVSLDKDGYKDRDIQGAFDHIVQEGMIPNCAPAKFNLAKIVDALLRCTDWDIREGSSYLMRETPQAAQVTGGPNPESLIQR